MRSPSGFLQTCWAEDVYGGWRWDGITLMLQAEVHVGKHSKQQHAGKPLAGSGWRHASSASGREHLKASVVNNTTHMPTYTLHPTTTTHRYYCIHKGAQNDAASSLQAPPVSPSVGFYTSACIPPTDVSLIGNVVHIAACLDSEPTTKHD